MGRTKNKSMKWQVQAAMLSKLCIGQSRHKAKEEIKKEGKSTPDGIYSWSTYNTYKKHCIAFAEWCKKTYGCKSIEGAKKHIQDYLDYRIDKGLSAWTIKMEASAIAKMYGSSTSDLKLITPDRKREDIKRSRKDCKHDKHISKEKHKDIIDFCKGCGLRRHELAQLKTENIIIEEDNVYIEVLQGKGGKRRIVEVLAEYREHIKSYHNDNIGEYVFKTIPQNLDIHSYRASYACELYKSLERPLDSLIREQKYYCKGDMKGNVYDKKAMMTVSRMLGHNRINVIASNYLWNLHDKTNGNLALFS
ncbi:MAG: hypothetical protein PHC56_08750 [Herbinix sp.]|nr:hypothetical protein [Herbinix sp.]